MQPDRAVVVGSIQKLSRPDNPARIAAERFDYVVVNEVHHADAPTYRRLLDRLGPAFLLGLTAAPRPRPIRATSSASSRTSSPTEPIKCGGIDRHEELRCPSDSHMRSRIFRFPEAARVLGFRLPIHP